MTINFQLSLTFSPIATKRLSSIIRTLSEVKDPSKQEADLLRSVIKYSLFNKNYFHIIICPFPPLFSFEESKCGEHE